MCFCFYYLQIETFIILPAFYFKSFQNLKMPKYATTHHEMTKKMKYISIKKHLVKIIVRERIWSNPRITKFVNKCRNSILMTRHYPDMGSASDWLKQISHTAWSVRSTSQIRWWHVISMKFLCSFPRRKGKLRWNFCACFSDLTSGSITKLMLAVFRRPLNC